MTRLVRFGGRSDSGCVIRSTRKTSCCKFRCGRFRIVMTKLPMSASLTQATDAAFAIPTTENSDCLLRKAAYQSDHLFPLPAPLVLPDQPSRAWSHWLIIDPVLFNLMRPTLGVHGIDPVLQVGDARFQLGDLFVVPQVIRQPLGQQVILDQHPLEEHHEQRAQIPAAHLAHPQVRTAPGPPVPADRYLSDMI